MSVLSKRKILVTGGSGFIGTNLIYRLLEVGSFVRATVHKRKPVVNDSRIEYVECDLTRIEDCKRVVAGMEYVFHCAGSTSGSAVIERTPLVHVTPNIVMNAQLLEAAYFAGIKKLLWISSSTGYPVSENRLVKEEEMMQDDPYDKYFCVGWMKRYTEVLCRMYSMKLRDPLTTVVLRPTNIYGEYDDFDFATSHVFPALLRKVVERHDPIEVWGTGNDVRDLIYVGDFVEAALLAMEKIESYNPINIGLGKGYSVKQMLTAMLEIDEFDNARIIFNSSKPTAIPIRLVDTSKAERLLGFQARTDLREGIRKTLMWYKENYKH